MQQTANEWKLLEWMPAEEGTDYAKYFQKPKAKYPSAPPDIFPQLINPLTENLPLFEIQLG